MEQKSNEKPIFRQKGILSSKDMIICCVNSAVGVGILKMGAAFTSGLIVSILVLFIVCFLSYYSFKLLVLSAAKCHESTFEEIWKSEFSSKTIIVPVFFTSFSMLLSMVSYMREIQSSAITICSKILVVATDQSDSITPKLQTYKMLVGSAVFVLFLIPVCCVAHVSSLVTMSYVSNCFLFLFLIYLIVMFGYEVKRVGFDPKHNFKLYQFKGHLTTCLSTTIFAFNIHPLTYPGMKHVKDSTQSNLLLIFRITMIIIMANYFIAGLFSYLTYFDENTGIILDYYPENTETEKILMIIGRILAFGFILLTIPFRLNACRYVILSSISDILSFPPEIWTFTGIIISLLALSLANLTEKFLTTLFIFSNIMASFLLFIFTPIFYLKANGTSDHLHAFISISFLVIGVISIIVIILVDGFSFSNAL